MSKKRNLIFICLLILGVFLITSCLPKPPVTEGILKGQVIVPEGSKQLTGQALADATINIIDPATGAIIATTVTDANGYYQVFVPAGGPYLLQAIKDGIKVQQITPQVEVGIEYDLGTADCSTTAVALIVQVMLAAEDYPNNPADINLADIEADPNFNDVMNPVCSTIEAGGNPAESAVVQQAVEDFLYPPTPTPPAVGTDTTLSDLTVNGTTITGFDPAILNYNKELPYGTTTIPTVGATTNDSNATKVITQAVNLNGTEAQRTATVVVTAEDGTTTKNYTVTFSVTLNDAKEIIYFFFEEDEDPAFEDDIEGDVDPDLHTVSLVVPYETDVTDLIAYFELSDGASATVGVTPTTQVSGVTANDFTLPVIYTIIAENSSTQNWMVTVYIDPPKTTTDIEEYEFTEADNPALSYNIEGTINYISHTVSLTVPYGIKNNLIAAFELAVGASATVGGTPTTQVSGVTANDFTLPVTYTVTAQDGTTTQDWIVTVNEEAVRYVATSGDNSNIGSESSPWLTIQYALNTAPNLCTVIVKDSGPYNETINFPSDRIVLLKNASGTTPVVNGDLGLCTVGIYGCPEGTVMEGFTITHTPGSSGKGIYIMNGSRVNINNCNIFNNDTSGGAGGLLIALGTNIVTLNDCIISNNTASFAGGIYCYGQNNILTINNCTISGNQANSGNGGGINSNSGTIIINGGIISENSASSSGGGIYQSLGTMTIQGCTISNNGAGDSFSAGICLKGGSNVIGGSGADMNTICSNYITGNSPTLDDQIGDSVSSLYGTYSGTNNISATCSTP